MQNFLSDIIKYGIKLLGIFAVLSILIYSTNKDFYFSYEDDLLVEKYDAFLLDQKNINNVFIGSSKIYRQIDPVQFDSLNVGATHSYNLAASNLFPPRSYDFIKQAILGTDYINSVFIELSPIANISVNYNADPNIYSINFKKYLDIINFCYSTNYPTLTRINYFAGYSVLFAYKYLGFGIKKYITLSLNLEKTEIKKTNRDNIPNRGFYSLDDQLNFSQKKDLIARRNEFLKNHKKFLNKSVAENTHRTNFYQEKTDKITSDLIKLADKLKSEGKQVIFIIPPKQSTEHLNFLLYQKSQLKEYLVMDFSDPEVYPEFYNLQNSFDRGHLNKNGARTLTKKIADQFLMHQTHPHHQSNQQP